MPKHPVEPLHDPLRGLDFADHFGDQQLVRDVLTRFAAPLQGTICYCLQFHRVDGGISWFEPYGIETGKHGLITDPDKDLPAQVPYDRLLVRDDSGHESWPVLAMDDAPSTTTSGLPDWIAAAAWRGQARLEFGNPNDIHRYAGYFKAVATNGQIPPSSEDLQHAFSQARRYLRGEVVSRLSDELRSGYSELHDGIATAVEQGQQQRAIAILCSLTTSHLLPVAFNRVVFFAPDDNDALVAVHGHGGACDAQSEQIQRAVASCVHTAAELIEAIDVHQFAGDALYEEVTSAANPLQLTSVSTSPSDVAKLVRGEMPPDYSAFIGAGESQGSLWSPPDFAQPIKLDDPWMSELRTSRPESPWWGNRNGTWFAVPAEWSNRGRCVFMFDLGSWSRFDESDDVIPRLTVVGRLLADFARHFRGVDWFKQSREKPRGLEARKINGLR